MKKHNLIPRIVLNLQGLLLKAEQDPAVLTYESEIQGLAYAANTKTCQILLKDENNNKLSSKKLQINLNNKVYSVSTDKNGIAKLNINLSGMQQKSES